jgi:hypothetical protein
VYSFDIISTRSVNVIQCGNSFSLPPCGP